MNQPPYFLVTDRQLRIVGHPITRWTNIDALLRYNSPSSGVVTTPRGVFTGEQLAPGNRLVMIRDGRTFLAGPIEKPGTRRWEASGENAGPGMMDVAWADDSVWLASRITFPDPAVPVASQTVDRWYATNKGEDILRALVNLNAGPSALTARRVPGLVLGAYNGLGSTITFGTRFDPLGDALRAVAATTGGLGYRVVQVGQTLEFQVYAPRDLSRAVLFSPSRGNLRAYEYDPDAPRANVAIVGGRDEGTARFLLERANVDSVAAWGRREVFVDERLADDDTGDTDELERAAAQALIEQGEQISLAMTTVDTPTQRYGVHYDLGDVVTGELEAGFVVPGVVRGVQYNATPQGEALAALIGSEEAITDPRWVTYLRDLARRTTRLEVR